jgi:hypothetical protein
MPGADHRLAASSDLDVAEPHLRGWAGLGLASRRRHPGITVATFEKTHEMIGVDDW